MRLQLPAPTVDRFRREFALNSHDHFKQSPPRPRRGRSHTYILHHHRPPRHALSHASAPALLQILHRPWLPLRSRRRRRRIRGSPRRPRWPRQVGSGVVVAVLPMRVDGEHSLARLPLLLPLNLAACLPIERDANGNSRSVGGRGGAVSGVPGAVRLAHPAGPHRRGSTLQALLAHSRRY